MGLAKIAQRGHSKGQWAWESASNAPAANTHRRPERYRRRLAWHARITHSRRWLAARMLRPAFAMRGTPAGSTRGCAARAGLVRIKPSMAARNVTCAPTGPTRRWRVRSTQARAPHVQACILRSVEARGLGIARLPRRATCMRRHWDGVKGASRLREARSHGVETMMIAEEKGEGCARTGRARARCNMEVQHALYVGLGSMGAIACRRASATGTGSASRRGYASAGIGGRDLIVVFGIVQQAVSRRGLLIVAVCGLWALSNL